jgi:hypothetical protein
VVIGRAIVLMNGSFFWNSEFDTRRTFAFGHALGELA